VDFKRERESLMRTVWGSEFQTYSAESRSACYSQTV